jgi:arylsulfatase A-like enzyme
MLSAAMRSPLRIEMHPSRDRCARSAPIARSASTERTASNARFALAARVALLALSFLAASCGQKPSPGATGRGVLILAIDALRADHMSFTGYDRRTTPTLDQLASQGVAMLQTYTTSPELVSAHASLLTGCDPTIVRRAPFADPESTWFVSDCYIVDAVPRLAQEFLAHGYRTAAFVDHPGLSSLYGFGAGFRDFYGYHSEALQKPSELGFQSLAAVFLQWLTNQDPSSDWFAYVHVNDLERIWQSPDAKWDTFFEPRAELSAVPPVAEEDRAFFAIPHARWSGGTVSIGTFEARYDGELRGLDAKLGRFFEGMRSKGRLSNTTVVIVGTYGIGFGESGLCVDSGTLSDSDLHVPLIFRPSPLLNCARGTKSEQLASTMDVAPTLLDLAKIAKPRGMHGVSQAGVILDAPGAAREYAFASGGLQSGFTVIDPRWCYEHSSPGTLQLPSLPAGETRPSTLSLSWYGDSADHSTEYRSFLHDRRTNSSTGHLVDSAVDAKTSERMAEAGRDWFTWMIRARDVMQRLTVNESSMDAATISELRRRGLVPDPR